VRQEAHFDLYLSVAQKVELLKLKRKTGISASILLLKGLSYWLSHEINLKKEAEIFKGLIEEREAKELEKETGDYLGSFDKYFDKMDRIDSAYRQGRISRKERDRLKKITKDNYEVTQRIKRKRFGTSTKDDRKREFLKKHPNCEVGKDGKIKKKRQT
jgi:hypothetical protein